MKDNTMHKSCYLLLCLMIVSTTTAALSLTCEKHLEAVEGQAMEVLCQSEDPIDSCQFEFPAFRKVKVYAGVKNKNYEFVGDYKKGECGVRFSAMKRELGGQVTAQVTFPDIPDLAEATINVTILNPPENCYVESYGHNFEFNEGDVMLFNCSCSNSNPLPTISLCIGDDEPFLVSGQTSMNASKTAEISDFDKKVVCVVHHPLLEHGRLTFVSTLTINHKPKAMSESFHEVGIHMSIKVTVSAYPKPHTYNWTTTNGKLLKNSWLTLKKDMHCIWEVGVNVSEITTDDLEHGSKLNIANSVGLYTTNVIPEQTKKDSNSHVYIIISIISVLIVLAICLTFKHFKIRIVKFLLEKESTVDCLQPPTHLCINNATSQEKTHALAECGITGAKVTD